MAGRNGDGALHGVSRRAALGWATALGAGALAGCLDGTDDGEAAPGTTELNDHDGDVGSDVDERTTALAARMVDAVDPELTVTGWRLHGLFVPEYVDGDGLAADARILGDAYREIVADGFDRRAMPTALHESGSVDFMVYLEPEWARAVLDGDWSDETYYAEVEASVH